jgi:hypothetical protein
MRPMTIAAALAALVSVACCAPAAIATTGTFEVPRLPGTTVPVQTIPTLTGPLIAGDATVYAVGGTDGAATVRLVSPGAPTRDVASFAPKQNAILFLHASPSRLVAIRTAYVCSDCKYMSYRSTLDALLAGPLGGPLATITQCEEGQPCAATYFCYPGRARFSGALDGDLLAVRDECGATASVTNLAGGPPVQLGPAEIVAVGGPYVAVGVQRTATTPAAIVVRDAASGAEIYRTPLPQAVGFPVTSLALLPDGTVVYAVNAPAGVTVAVASRAAPGGRVLRANLPYGTAVIGARAAGALLRFDTRLDLVPLDGAASRGFDVPDPTGSVAFDGRTIAWAQRTCVTTAITTWTLGEPAPAAPDLRCPTALASRAAVTMLRDRRLGVVLACPATPRGGCTTTVRLTAIRRGRLRRGVNGAERSYRLGSVPAALDPGERTPVELLVPAGAARWVRRHAPLRLRIDVRSDRSGAYRPPGDSGIARQTVALRAQR